MLFVLSNDCSIVDSAIAISPPAALQTAVIYLI